MKCIRGLRFESLDYLRRKAKRPPVKHGARLFSESSQPLGKLVQAELRNKLDAPDLALGWSELRASDFQARARSFKSMVDGGMDVTKAAALSGLLLDEE